MRWLGPGNPGEWSR